MKKVLVGVLVGWLSCSAAFAGEKLVVGTESTFPPFEFLNESGQVTGFDMDLAGLVAHKLGMELQVSDMNFDGLIPALMSGKIDLIAAGMTVTDERSKVVQFTDVYYVTPDDYLVKKGDFHPTSVEDLKGKTVGVQLGTTPDLYLSSLSGLKEVRRYQKTDDVVRDLLLGRLDAAAVDSAVAKDLLAGNKEYGEGVTVAFSDTHNAKGFALAVSKKNEALFKKVNEALKEVMASPEFEALKKKWKID